jgi:hypothetical protein
VRVFGDRLHLRVAPGKIETVRKTLGHNRNMIEVRSIPATLEDVFILLSERKD